MSEDLIKHLRSGRWFGATTGRQAADRIEMLQALLEAHTEPVASLLRCLTAWELALESIARNTCCAACQEAAIVAREALAEKVAL